MPADNRVLIIDSNAAARKRLAETLSRLGYAATLSADATAPIDSETAACPLAIVALRGTPPESAAQIAELRARMAQVGLIATGRRSFDATIAAWRAGADAYLPEPVRSHQLQNAIEHAEQIRGARAAQMALEQELEMFLARLGAPPYQDFEPEGLRRLVAMLTHQINNPLTSILGMAELLVEDLPPTHPEHEYAQMILASAARIRDVVWRLADVAQPDE